MLYVFIFPTSTIYATSGEIKGGWFIIWILKLADVVGVKSGSAIVTVIGYVAETSVQGALIVKILFARVMNEFRPVAIDVINTVALSTSASKRA